MLAAMGMGDGWCSGLGGPWYSMGPAISLLVFFAGVASSLGSGGAGVESCGCGLGVSGERSEGASGTRMLNVASGLGVSGVEGGAALGVGVVGGGEGEVGLGSAVGAGGLAVEASSVEASSEEGVCWASGAGLAFLTSVHVPAKSMISPVQTANMCSGLGFGGGFTGF